MTVMETTGTTAGRGSAGEALGDLTCRLKARGSHQIQLKLHYPLASRPRQIFETDICVFAPDRLGLTASSYGVPRVLEETTHLVRHSSPRIPLDALPRPEMADSPLSRLGSMLAAGAPSPAAHEQVIRELKLLVNAYSGECGAAVRKIRRMTSAGRPDVREARRQVDLIRSLPHAYRSLRRLREAGAPTPEIRQAMAWADEGLSVVMERSLHRAAASLGGRGGVRVMSAEIRAAVEGEWVYRAQAGIALLPADGSSAEARAQNERVLLRIRALKRWSQSALYMSRVAHREGARIGQVVAGAAAALAMTVAVVAAAFAERLFATYSLPWAFIIIFGYILKDRLKDAARNVLAALIPRWVSDRSHRLVDGALGTAGLLRETVGFRTAGSLPQEIRVARTGIPSPMGELPGETTPESVVHYRTWMRVSSARLLEDHRRLHRLTAILRWGVHGWLEEMDAPYAALGLGGEGGQMLARHVYPVHVVVRIRERGVAEGRIYRYRVTLSREGIVRTESLPESVAALAGPKEGR